MSAAPALDGIAEHFVDALIKELPEMAIDLAAGTDPVSRNIWRRQLIFRAARAMQDAVEETLDTMREEVLTGRRR